MGNCHFEPSLRRLETYVSTQLNTKKKLFGSGAHAGYRQYYNGVGSVRRAHVGTTLTPKNKKEGVM